MLFRSIAFVFFLVFFSVPVQAAKPLRIDKIDDIPLSNVKEVLFPDGERYLLAAELEPTATQGIPPNRAISMAERVASLKARALLARFINGEEFKQTETFKDTYNVIGNQGKYSTSRTEEIIAVVRGAVLKGVEVIEVDRKTAGVKVVMGVSKRSTGVADYYRERMESHQPEFGTEADNSSGNTPRQEYWVDPRLRGKSNN